MQGVPLKLQVHGNRWFTFSKPTLYNIGNQLSTEAMKPSKLLHHTETKHPALKHKPLEFFKRKKREYEEQKHLLKANTSSVCLHWEHHS